jgi:hypothetical protein
MLASVIVDRVLRQFDAFTADTNLKGINAIDLFHDLQDTGLFRCLFFPLAPFAATLTSTARCGLLSFSWPYSRST